VQHRYAPDTISTVGFIEAVADVIREELPSAVSHIHITERELVQAVVSLRLRRTREGQGDD
jgi:NADH:ubiquinone oxidoreductase subunit H